LLLLFLPLFVLAAIAIPNLRTAMNRSKQKRTMADIRTVATAWEARVNDAHTFDAAPRRKAGMTAVPARDLERALVPTYTKTLPVRDGWERPLQFVTDGQDYFIRSSGRDGRLDHQAGAGTSFDDDIVYTNGAFTEYPEGVE
jgi:general secretion pathway protein G